MAAGAGDGKTALTYMRGWLEMARFENKVVIVTGAGGGIGRAASLRFASEGASIVAVDIDDATLAETVELLEAAGSPVLSVHADVRISAEVEGYVSAAVEKFGGVDVLFNNAGIEGVISPLDDYPEDIFDDVIAVNVKGVYLGLRHVVPAMKKRGGGAIVNSASGAGLRGTPTLIAYGASKHAVVGMTKSAGFELAEANIRVNAVCPGVIDTRMMRSIEAGTFPDSPEDYKTAINERVPQARYGTPDEVAGLVAFLASDDATYITGSTHVIDGGLQST